MQYCSCHCQLRIIVIPIQIKIIRRCKCDKYYHYNRGLTQASLNAQDGISTVQTAEGALNEVQDMLQRMNELAVKSSNGTNSEDDREYIQNEIDQLTTEIDRVSTTTKFNETYLLQGEGRQQAKAKNELASISLIGADGKTAVATQIKASIAAGNTYTAGKVTVGSVTAK